MLLRYAIVDRDTLTELRAKVLSKDRELAQQSNEIMSMRHAVRSDDHRNALEILKVKEQLAASTALNNMKQQEVAQLRNQVAEANARADRAIADAADERHKMMDWIAGVNRGTTIFNAPLVPAQTPESTEPEKVAVNGKEVPINDVTEAIRTVGTRARNITKHIETKKGNSFKDEFGDAMRSSGVKQLFAEDKAEGEAQAVVSSTGA